MAGSPEADAEPLPSLPESPPETKAAPAGPGRGPFSTGSRLRKEELQELAEMSREYVIPLEDREHYSAFRGLWKTWAEVCLSPRNFFSKLQFYEEVGWPAFFAFLYAGLTSGIYFLWMVVLLLASGALSNPPGLAHPPEVAELSRQAACVWGAIALMAPIMVMAFFFLRVLGTHLLLLLCGGGRKGLVMTLRAMAYAQAPGLFAVVPCLGLPIRWLWSMGLEILGLAEVHETDTWRAALAILLPLALCCLAALTLLALIWSPLMQEVQRMGWPSPEAL